MIRYSWAARIARAESLSQSLPESAELLRFYAQVARLQSATFDAFESGALAEREDLVPQASKLLSLVAQIGPPTLADAAESLASRPAVLQDLIERQWSNPASDEPPTREGFFARALLQPYAEWLAQRAAPSAAHAPNLCPVCGARPAVAVLRGEGDGAKRSLLCSLCATEWEYRRLLCPGCGEEGKDKLPVYLAEGLDYARVEACDTCRCYLKAVDLTKNGNAVPIVDELATVALNLWAEENGYSKLQPNLLGL